MSQEKDGGKTPRIYYSFGDYGGSNGKDANRTYSGGYAAIERPRIRFSRDEIKHLALATVVLTIAFSFALSRPGWITPSFNKEFLLGVLDFMPAAFAGVVTAFLLHELGHKFTAQRFGLWSEFRYSMSGLVMALFVSVVFGIVFAAPGAVYIGGSVNKRENGLISLAGPGVNIVIAFVSLPLLLFVFANTAFWGQLFYTVFFINSFLAMFNMLPFGNMDGKKIMSWKPAVFGITLCVSVGFVVAAFNIVELYALIMSLL